MPPSVAPYRPAFAVFIPFPVTATKSFARRFLPCFDILRATEGDLAPVACLAAGAEPCSRAPFCRTLPMWKKYYELTNAFFDGMTLADLMENTASGDYVI